MNSSSRSLKRPFFTSLSNIVVITSLLLSFISPLQRTVLFHLPFALTFHDIKMAAAYSDFQVDGDFLHYKVGGKHCVWDSNNRYTSRNDEEEISKLEPHAGHWVTKTGREYAYRRSTVADLREGDGLKYRQAIFHLNAYLKSKYDNLKTTGGKSEARKRKNSRQTTNRNKKRSAERNNAEPLSASVEPSTSKQNTNPSLFASEGDQAQREAMSSAGDQAQVRDGLGILKQLWGYACQVWRPSRQA